MKWLLILLSAAVFSIASLVEQKEESTTSSIVEQLELSHENISLVDEIISNDRLFDKSDLYNAIVNSSAIATVEKVLEKKEIPEIFLYIPVIESKYNNTVRYKGASGIWQLVPVCAKFTGLKVSRKYDERQNWLKATEAATNYFLYLHKKFKKWYLVVMAYNCGEGTLQKAIDATGSSDLATLISSRSPLPSTTKGYIKRLMWIYNTAQAQRFQDVLVDKRDTHYEKVLVNTRYSLDTIAKFIGVSKTKLSAINDTWKIDSKGKKQVSIFIPSNKKDLVQEKFGGDD